MKVVIVDSLPDNETVFQNLVLKLQDCDPVSFSDAKVAYEWCVIHEPDLMVVGDLQPQINGFELIEKFRALYPEIPVLIVMEKSASESRFHALQIGATDFLDRPPEALEFSTRVKNMLALRKCRKELADRVTLLAEEVNTAYQAFERNDTLEKVLAERTSWLVNEVNEAYQAMERNDTQVSENVELIKSNLKLEADNRSKNDFLARVSHDLRTPLAAILGYSDMLARKSHLTQHIAEFDVIRRNAQHLITLIDELLEFARNSIGANTIKPVPVYLHALIDHVLQQAEIFSRDSGNRVELVINGQLPHVVELDPLRVRRVLFNLMSNAAKFTRKGTVTLEVQAEPVDASGPGMQKHQSLLFKVSDTGTGIDPAEQERIFEPFYRANGLEDSIPGSGLGLAICRQLAQAMGGSITLSSVPGQGSCFSFRLSCPLASETDIDIADSTFPVEIDGEGRAILLVEDIADIRHFMTDQLTSAGFAVTTASNGREALLEVQNGKIQFSAVITDQAMPEMDGWALLSALRLHYGKTVPVILLSASPALAPEGWPKDVRFDANFLKPVDATRLLTTLARLLKLSCSKSAFITSSILSRANAKINQPAKLTDMRLPDAGCLKDFHGWAEQGALSILEIQATELSKRLPEFSAFADFVLTHAEHLDLEGIAAFCAEATGTTRVD